MFVKSMVLAAALATTVTGAAVADDGDWVGFYRAIDVVDGSVDSLSIVSNSDGTYRIVMSSPRLGACAGGTQAGIITATGHVVGGKLERRDVMYKCEGSDEMKPLPDSVYTRDSDSHILMLEGPMGRLNYYHPVGAD